MQGTKSLNLVAQLCRGAIVEVQLKITSLLISISQFHNHAQNVHAVVLAGHMSRKHGGFLNEWKYFIKYNINVSIIIHFKQYFPSIIQSGEFTGCVARQNNGLYVLRMIVKLAYCGKRNPRIK